MAAAISHDVDEMSSFLLWKGVNVLHKDDEGRDASIMLLRSGVVNY